MIDFEEELTQFEPIKEVEEAADAIHNTDITDLTDILREMVEKSEGK